MATLIDHEGYHLVFIGIHVKKYFSPSLNKEMAMAGYSSYFQNNSYLNFAKHLTKLEIADARERAAFVAITKTLNLMKMEGYKQIRVILDSYPLVCALNNCVNAHSQNATVQMASTGENEKSKDALALNASIEGLEVKFDTFSDEHALFKVMTESLAQVKACFEFIQLIVQQYYFSIAADVKNYTAW